MEQRAMKPLVTLVLAVLPVLAACEDSDTSGPSADDRASLSVYLTDAPGDVEAVWMEIVGVSLQHESEGPLELLDTPTELILLTDLVETTQLLVSDREMDVSTYSQLRLRVGDAILLSTDGIAYLKGDPILPAELEGAPIGELVCPSCSQSGLKVTIPNGEMELEEGDAALILDFDVAQSFGHRAGNSGKWIMHPVIHGTLTGGDPGATGAIRGTVTLALDSQNEPITIPACPEGEARSIEDFVPTATTDEILDGEGEPIVRTGEVSGDGTFQINFLDAATYTLGHGTLDLGDFVLTFDATVDPVQVTVGNEIVDGVAYTINSASCQPAG